MINEYHLVAWCGRGYRHAPASALLREHFAAGWLAHDKLDGRVTAALQAKTYGELRRLTADLPGPAVMPAGQPWPRHGR